MITFLRALAASPPIMLLDEATSSIDPPTEALIQTALRELLRERTALVIAHRLSTLEGSDRLLILSGGKLEDLGTHRELMMRDGKYRQLYELQQLGQPSGQPLSPDSAECLYNLGFISKRMMNKKDSKKYFNEFIEKRRLSWWVKKAKEHLTSLY